MLTKTPAQGGLGLGTIGTSVLIGVILVVAVAKESQLERARPQA